MQNRELRGIVEGLIRNIEAARHPEVKAWNGETSSIESSAFQ